MREAPPPRRTLAGLPGLLRPPGRELLDEHRPAHECRLRLHLDAHQRAARRGADPRRGGLRRVAQDLPRRGVPRVQGRPLGDARPSSPASCRCSSEVLDALRIRHLEVEGFEADDVIATLTTAGRRAGHRGGHLHRRPRRVPAGQRQGHPALPGARRVRGVADGPRPRSSEKYLVPPERYSDLAALSARPATTCPACPGVGPEDGRQVARPVRRPRRGRRPRRRDQGQGRREPARAPRRRAAQPPAQPSSSTTSTLPLSVDDLERQSWDREEVHQVFDGLEFRVLRERLFATFEVEQDEVEGGFELEGERVHRRRPGGALRRRRRRAPVPHGVVVVRPLPRRHRRRRRRGAGRRPTAAPPTSTSPR